MARYYPNGSNRKRSPRESERQEEVNQATIHNPVTNFWDDNFRSAENAWNGNIQSERDYWIQSMIMGTPFINGVFKANWNRNALLNYMSMYGLNWNDLKSRNIFGGQFGNSINMMSPINYVSDMVKELYS